MGSKTSTLILANTSLYNIVLVITITVLLVILLVVLCSINNLYKDLKLNSGQRSWVQLSLTLMECCTLSSSLVWK